MDLKFEYYIKPEKAEKFFKPENITSPCHGMLTFLLLDEQIFQIILIGAIVMSFLNICFDHVDILRPNSSWIENVCGN